MIFMNINYTILEKKNQRSQLILSFVTLEYSILGFN